MPLSNRGAQRALTALLGGATLFAGLGFGLAAPAAALGPLIHVSVNDKATAIIGTDGTDRMVISKAGTATNPLVHVDAATPLDIDFGCSPVAGDPTQATCVLTFDGTTPVGLHIATFGGDDYIANGSSAFDKFGADGGPGRDVMIGSTGRDSFIGGTGDDVLRGNGGDDKLHGGEGGDQLFGGEGDNDVLDGGTGPDVFDGGPGSADIVTYEYRQARVTVDLKSNIANLGEDGEGDRIAGGIEGAHGGYGNDTLHGNDGNNHLDGDWGDDVIAGRRGFDIVLGDAGKDLLSGNVINVKGNDLPNADGLADLIDGQENADNCVRSNYDGDLVSNCEIVINDN